MPSKPCKFSAVIFLSLCYNDTGIYTWLYFRKSAKLVKVRSSLSMSKCFVTGLMWIKVLIPILLLLVKSVYYASHNIIHLRYTCFNI